MKIITKLFLFLFVFHFLSSSVIAQPFRIDSLQQNKNISHKFFTLQDSVNTIANAYNNKAANQAFSNGLIWTLVGGAVGLGAAYLYYLGNKPCGINCGIAFVAFPIMFGTVGFVGGTTISYFINYDDRNTIVNYPYSKMRFKHLGVNAIFTIPKHGSGKTSLGLSYRNLCEEFYLPNKLTFLFGLEPWGYYSYKKNLPNKFDDHDSYIMTDEINFGVSAVHVNYNSPFSFLYGLEVGMNYATAKISVKTEEEYLDVPYLTLFLPYVDLMVGFNVNLFSFLSWDIAYVYEPYGIYESLKPANHSLKSYQWKINSSLSFYF